MIPLDELLASPADRMPAILARFASDRAAIERRYPNVYSPLRFEKLTDYFETWQNALNTLPFDEFTRPDRLDWLLFRNLLTREIERLQRSKAEFEEISELVPFVLPLTALDDARRNHEAIDAEAAAGVLDVALQSIPSKPEDLKQTLGLRAAKATESVLETLKNWWTFYGGYDPLVGWWCRVPYEKLEKALAEYATTLKPSDSDAIIGDPVGRAALIAELRASFIPYTPEELIAKADADRQWCLQELERAAQELGLPNGRAAIEAAKQDHCKPGEQVALIRDLTREAIAFVEDNELLTVPEIARDGWRMIMMSPEMQRVNPFFLGGETIWVSYPTDSMEHDFKQMSQRGNNKHFARATVHHELIPGHYMQSFFQERYRPYRRQFWTAFWVEGWTLHWEFLLWERGFPQTSLQKIGMLFWRLHRCARVLFSLKFHLGEWSPQQCIDLLVEEVGHEPKNAEAEVRRSFGGNYDPLYQLAYLIGGMQVHALHTEWLESGKTDRAFHDAFLRENLMPIPALRAFLLNHSLEKDTDLLWHF
ncbi:MAG: DUF885 family protein [Armatimonadetes bacterium]|nr:DUF885 family protein [Armatimonadota bacterium]